MIITSYGDKWLLDLSWQEYMQPNHVVHLKLTILYINYTSIKKEKRNGKICINWWEWGKNHAVSSQRTGSWLRKGSEDMLKDVILKWGRKYKENRDG